MTEIKKVAIVTGGSRGIGKAIVYRLASLGYQIAFNYLSSSQAAEQLVKEIESKGGACRAYQVDIKDFNAVKQWIDEVKKDFGGIDVLINNAGIIADKALMLMSPDDWQNVVDTNLNGMFNAAKSCIVTMLKQKSGIIINMSSVSGIIGLPRQTNYSATKGGMNAFTKALAKEVGGYGIRVNAIAPGFIETDILSAFSEEEKLEIAKGIPMQYIGSCDDVAGCVEFLLSVDAKYITGQVITVDGGLAMR